MMRTSTKRMNRQDEEEEEEVVDLVAMAVAEAEAAVSTIGPWRPHTMIWITPI